MPYPSFIKTRQVSLGTVWGLESPSQLALKVSIKATRSLVWLATGDRFINLGTEATGEVGGELVFELPETDTPGWGDPATGQAIDVSAPNSYTHRYSADVSFVDADGVSRGTGITLGPFVVPAGEDVLDLDKMLSIGSTPGGLVLIPDLWTAQVAAAQAAAEAAAVSAAEAAEYAAGAGGGGTGLGTDSFGIPLTASGLRLSTTEVINLREHFDPKAPPTNYDAALTAAIDRQNQAAVDGWVIPIYLPHGKWRIGTTVTVVDKSVAIQGPGVLEGVAGATVLQITQNYGAGIAGTYSVLRGRVDGSVSTSYSRDSIFTPTSATSLLGVEAGQLFFLDSNTFYTPTFVSINDNKTYKGQYFPVAALGITVSMVAGKGGVPADAVVVGESSGARARVRGNRHIANGPTTTVNLTLDKVTNAAGTAAAMFTPGETLSTIVAGVTTTGAATIQGSPYVISSTRIIDAHETSAQLHKPVNPNMKVDLDIKLDAYGDTDSLVGSANRDVAIQLRGLADSRVHAYVKNGWSRAVRWQGCFMPEGDGYCFKLPNDAVTTEQAYGYAFEVFGCTEFGRFSFLVRNVRHGFTDNTTATSARMTSDFPTTGVPKYNTIHDSKVIGNISAGFDSHGGGWETTFENCHVYGVFAGGRPTTHAVGFQARGAGMRFINCSAVGVTVGWRIASNTFDYDWDSEVVLEGCSVRDYTSVAYEIGAQDMENITPQKQTSFILQGCSEQGEGVLDTVSGNDAVGYLVVSGENIQIIGCRSSKISGQPIDISALGGTSILDKVFIKGHIFDYTSGPAFTAPITIHRAPTQPIVMDDWTAITPGVASSAPPGFWVTVDGVIGAAKALLRVGDLKAPYRSNNTTVLNYANGSTAANVELVAIRKQGNTIYGQASTTIPVIAAGASYTQTIAAVGTRDTDVASANFSVAVPDGVIQEIPRTAADAVTVRFTNIRTTASVASAAGTLSTIVNKRGAVL